MVITPRRGRAGFTLVEILIVVTIIAILFALTAAAVMRAQGAGQEVQARNDIQQLGNAIAVFKTQYQVDYLPSVFTIRGVYQSADPDLAYLRSAWPRIGTLNPANGTVAVNWGPINPVVTAAGATGITIKGGACLTLFLAGPGLNGFSNSPADPMRVAAVGEQRIGPFFEFNPTKLRTDPSITAFPEYGIPGTFVGSLIDPYGMNQPYLYFSSSRAGNDYPGALVTGPIPNLNLYSQSGVRPFFDAASKQFVNARGYQIICAGRDGQFSKFAYGARPNMPNFWTVWTNGQFDPSQLPTSPDPKNPTYCRDDIANFHPTKLGTAAN